MKVGELIVQFIKEEKQENIAVVALTHNTFHFERMLSPDDELPDNPVCFVRINSMVAHRYGEEKWD